MFECAYVCMYVFYIFRGNDRRRNISRLPSVKVITSISALAPLFFSGFVLFFSLSDFGSALFPPVYIRLYEWASEWENSSKWACIVWRLNLCGFLFFSGIVVTATDAALKLSSSFKFGALVLFLFSFLVEWFLDCGNLFANIGTFNCFFSVFRQICWKSSI